MALLSLPNELLYMIIENPILGILDLSNLCRTNHHLNTRLTPLLIRNGGLGNVLLFAAQRDFVNLAQNALALGAHVEVKGYVSSYTPLRWAARLGHKLVAKLLLQHGADVASADKYEWTALHWAAATGNRFRQEATQVVRGVEHEAVVNLLLDNLADINAQDWVKRTPLCVSILYGNEAMVKLLLRRGADISLGSVSWLRSLAPGSNEEVIFRLLMEQDSRSGTTRIPDSELGATLLNAVSSGNEQAVKILLAHGVVLESARDKRTGDNALQIAVARGHKNMITLLVDVGLDINMTDRDGCTFLHRARCLELMAFLLERGTYANGRDSLKQTPLHLMARLKVDTAVIGCINLLLAKGANIEARDIYGRTPLHRAVISSTLEVVKLLLQNKASTASQDDGGLTALHWASIARRPDIIRLLVDAGADITVRSHNRRTLLHEIIHLSSVEMKDCYKENTVWVVEDGSGVLSYKSISWSSWGSPGEQPQYEQATWKEIVTLLLDLGSGLLATDSTGDTPCAAAWAVGWDSMADIIANYRPPKVLLDNRFPTHPFDTPQWHEPSPNA